ncbi:MAG: YcjF family protein [Bacilli bacterium]
MKKRNTFWIMIGIGVSLVILLILISSILSVGERLRSISKYVEYAFYGLSILLVYFLIINPVRIILFAPTFSLTAVLGNQEKNNRRIKKRITHNLIKSEDVKAEDKQLLEQGLKDEALLEEQLKTYFQKTLKQEINKIILHNAKTVMISTAISQNGRLDLITVLVVNLKMIKEIVLKSGFRPSYAKLGKLSANVLGTALIAEGLEGLDFNDIFPASTTNFLSEIPLIKPLASSIIQGISNALLTIRVGIITRKYLYAEYKNFSKTEVRRDSIKESMKMLPLVLKDALTFLPNQIAKIFQKRKLSPEEQEVYDAMQADA